MQRVKIVTDSTSDIPAEIAEKLGITKVPLYIHFGSKTYRDGELSQEKFFEKIDHVYPTTSQPNQEDFQSFYIREAERYKTDKILSIHISEKLSSTMNSALKVAEELKNEIYVEVIDSQSCSMGLGLIAIAAAEAANAGESIEKIKERVLDVISRTYVFALLDTLEYLKRGGRIGKASAFLGSLLNIKPIIGIKNGEVVPYTRSRTWKNGIEGLYKISKQHSPFEYLSVIYGLNEVNEFAEGIKNRVQYREFYLAQAGSVIAAHTGPKSLGIAFNIK